MANSLNVAQVFIVHVRADDGVRRAFIKEQMARHQITFDFMLEGDMSDLNRENMGRYFTPNLVDAGATPRESCTFKHFLIYEEMVRKQTPEALIFEDDAMLAHNFVDVFNKTMVEWRNRSDIDPNRLFISYENSLLLFIPGTKRQPGVHLYKAPGTRCAGAYYITLEVARKILDFTKENKCNFAVDWQHKTMVEHGLIDVYWCEPAIVEQGSHNGHLPTMLDDKKHGWWRRMNWNIQRFYKRHILHR
jgi:glycosyl transferase family 25